MTHSSSPAVVVDDVSVADRGEVVLDRVRLSVASGSVFGILGRGRAPGVFLECLAGARRPTSGRVTILGLDARSRLRLRSSRLFLPRGRERDLSRRSPRVLLLEDPEPGADDLAGRLRELAARGTAVVFSSARARLAEDAADRVALLSRGRVLAEGSPRELVTRFRRIRYANSRTETRTDFGNELDEFQAVRVRVRGWGIEAVVSDFDEAAFDRFCRIDGVEDAKAERVSLEEILEAVGGERGE